MSEDVPIRDDTMRWSECWGLRGALHAAPHRSGGRWAELVDTVRGTYA